MDRTHYRIFDERTGDPAADNRARQINRRISRSVRESFRVTAGGSGWHRKKALTKTTMVDLIRLHLSVMKQLHDQRTHSSEPDPIS